MSSRFVQSSLYCSKVFPIVQLENEAKDCVQKAFLGLQMTHTAKEGDYVNMRLVTSDKQKTQG